MVAGGGHGCIVSSILEPRKGHSFPKNGSVAFVFRAYRGAGGRNTLLTVQRRLLLGWFLKEPEGGSLVKNAIG